MHYSFILKTVSHILQGIRKFGVIDENRMVKPNLTLKTCVLKHNVIIALDNTYTKQQIVSVNDVIDFSETTRIPCNVL